MDLFLIANVIYVVVMYDVKNVAELVVVYLLMMMVVLVIAVIIICLED